MPFQNIQVPAGEKITFTNGRLHVPDQPIVAFIEGDGIGQLGGLDLRCHRQGRRIAVKRPPWIRLRRSAAGAPPGGGER